MGKDGDLWDDSVLINAFEDSISKYKKIHGGQQHYTSKEAEVVKSSEGSLSTIDEQIPHNERSSVADADTNVASDTRTNLEETHKSQPNRTDHAVGPLSQEPDVQPQYSVQDYSNTQGGQEYTQLLNQYYELEDQRQKILQQLHQYGGWSYQDSGSSTQWGNVSASQEQAPAYCQAYPAVAPLNASYACQCMVAPCSFGNTCTAKTCDSSQGIRCNEKSLPLEGEDVIKTAAGAAEKALSSLKSKSKGKGTETTEGEGEESACETDLTVVLNAWYSAGLYTGKYLAEQAAAKKKKHLG